LNEETGIYEYFGSITGIKKENLTRKFVGVGVVKYSYEDKAEYVVVEYANNDIANDTRSIYQVAKLAAQDDKLNASAKLWIQTNYIDVVENAVTQLSGKKLSILGDSISTFTGVSNDTNANATIGDNEVFYYKQMTMDDTWWKQAADAADMSILVNNSWAGSNVATNYGNETKGGCTARAENLHDVNGVTPDIIAVYMGINDCGCLTDLGEFDSVSDVWDGTQYVGDTEKFATAYATMVHKLTTKYDAAEVFLFTLPRNNYLWQGTKEQYNALQDEYNKMIYKIADVFGCQVVDVAASVGEDYNAYLLNDGIHPNEKGMDIITAAFETALYSYYYETLN
jgi:lysophospholipase L1-like esterase